MVIKNKHTVTKLKVTYLFVISILIIVLLEGYISGIYKNLIKDEFIFTSSIVFLIFSMWRGLPILKYDSDGEVLIFKKYEPVLITRILHKQQLVEFPKQKLIKYEISSFLLRKKLYLHLDHKNKPKIVKVTISYLNNDEVSLLEKSLNKVLKNNSKEIINERRAV